VAIAAGVALIAVGTIAKSALSNAAGGGGGVQNLLMVVLFQAHLSTVIKS
jgi:hypothetical protein